MARRTPRTNHLVRLVNASSHHGRLYLAYLSIEGRPWKNTKGTFKGYPSDHYFASEDIPNDVDYLIESQGLVILHHLKGAARDNLRHKDPRKNVREWKSPLTTAQLQDLNGTQQNHFAVLTAYLEPWYSWDDIPPFRLKDGRPPWYLHGVSSNELTAVDES